MSALLRRVAATLGVLAVAFVGLLLLAGTASAEPEPPDRCLRPNRYGELPTCTWDGFRWTRSYEGGAGDPLALGPGDAFGALVLLALVGGVAFTCWKVSTARRMARESGMSTRDATTMALLTDDGFEATYLASNLRGRTGPAPGAASAPAGTVGTEGTAGTVAQRLRELGQLRDQ